MDMLHIVNGDSTRIKLEESKIAGEVAVWREVLSDGPCTANFAEQGFWKTRAAFMTGFFDLPEAEYNEKTTAEFQKISAFANYSEVTLWFEYDLFCQVNLMGLLHWFYTQDRQDTKISLICVGWEEGYEHLVALGELPTENYPALFSRRRILGTSDFQFASEAYLAYCSANPTDLENFTLLPSNEFPYLKEALKAHFERFPLLQTGFNCIETKMIELVKSGVGDSKKLVGEMLRWQAYFGFGDAQYFHYLNRLKPIFEDFENLRLKQEIDSSLIDRNYHLGGALVSEWRWDEDDQELKPAVPD